MTGSPYDNSLCAILNLRLAGKNLLFYLKRLLAAALLCGSINVSAQPVPDIVYLSKILREGLYLDGFLGLERTAKLPGTDQGSVDLARSFVLGATSDYSFNENGDRCPTADILREIKTAELTDAISEIVQRARNTDIVILNENHLSPRNRAFALQVVRALRPLGYSNLAMEGLNNRPVDAEAMDEMAKLAQRGYVTRSNGIYTNEPMFAELIRQTLSLGYKVYAYDVSSSRNPLTQVAERDEGQAQMINRRIIAPKIKGKLLIYAGFSHAVEVPFGRDGDRQEEWMARRLKRITGIDPLTIDQTEQINPGCLPSDAMEDSTLPNDYGDVVLQKEGVDRQIGAYKGVVDLQVIHLPVPPINHRPAWMTQIGRRPLPIPAEMLTSGRTRLVQAFVANASTDAVPIDQILIGPSDGAPPPLMVPDMNVTLRVQDSAISRTDVP